MGIFDFLKPRQNSANTAKQRLQVLISATRAEDSRNYLPALRQDILAVLQKHVPGFNPGFKAPAMPKLMMPRVPSAIAASTRRASRASSPPPATAMTPPERSAMRASALRPVAAITSPRGCTAITSRPEPTWYWPP